MITEDWWSYMTGIFRDHGRTTGRGVPGAPAPITVTDVRDEFGWLAASGQLRWCKRGSAQCFPEQRHIRIVRPSGSKPGVLPADRAEQTRRAGRAGNAHHLNCLG